jgi:hypothetical protein
MPAIGDVRDVETSGCERPEQGAAQGVFVAAEP